MQGSGQIVVRRVGELRGTIDVPGAKNAVLKLMAATILADGTYELTNVPTIVDVTIMAELLDAIGIRTDVPEPGRLRMTNTGDLTPVAPYELVERIRASVNVLGPLLTRCGRVRLSMPGGDDFGARPIDMHVAGLEAMGAEFKFSHGELEATADRLHGAEVTFGFPSVGATENLVTAAVFADGVTTIDNAAREPEVVDLCEMLVAMGADISGIGTAHAGRAWRRTGVAAPGRPPHRARPHPGGDVRRRGGRRRRRAAHPRGPPDHMQNVLAAVRRDGPRRRARRRPAGRRARTGCARSTCRRCRTRASPPTTSRCSSPCCRSPTASASSRRTSTRAASATSRS